MPANTRQRRGDATTGSYPRDLFGFLVFFELPCDRLPFEDLCSRCSNENDVTRPENGNLENAIFEDRFDNPMHRLNAGAQVGRDQDYGSNCDVATETGPSFGLASTEAPGLKSEITQEPWMEQHS